MAPGLAQAGGSGRTRSRVCLEPSARGSNRADGRRLSFDPFDVLGSCGDDPLGGRPGDSGIGARRDARRRTSPLACSRVRRASRFPVRSESDACGQARRSAPGRGSRGRSRVDARLGSGLAGRVHGRSAACWCTRTRREPGRLRRRLERVGGDRLGRILAPLRYRGGHRRGGLPRVAPLAGSAAGTNPESVPMGGALGGAVRPSTSRRRRGRRARHVLRQARQGRPDRRLQRPAPARGLRARPSTRTGHARRRSPPHPQSGGATDPAHRTNAATATWRDSI